MEGGREERREGGMNGWMEGGRETCAKLKVWMTILL